MANWEQIPRDVLVEIAKRMEFYEDAIISKVCPEWRATLERENTWSWRCSSCSTQPPWLMLVDPHNSASRRYYSMVNDKLIKLDLPPLVLGKDQKNDIYRYFSSRGWLISVSHTNNNITLFNPLSKKVIMPPNIPLCLIIEAYERWDCKDWPMLRYVTKFILSASPNPSDECQGGDDFSLAMIFGDKKVALWRPGQEGWTKLVIESFNLLCHDLCFFKGELYGINETGEVVGLGNMSEKREPRIVVNLSQKTDLYSTRSSGNWYIMEWMSEEGVETLLVVRRYIPHNYIAETKTFHLCQVNVENGEVKELKFLGNKSVFVGLNSSFYVEASQRGCKHNCIYFTDDNIKAYDYDMRRNHIIGKDVGIYSLYQSKVMKPCYEGRSCMDDLNPPMWVEAPHH